jgi:hypothetical protein
MMDARTLQTPQTKAMRPSSVRFVDKARRRGKRAPNSVKCAQSTKCFNSEADKLGGSEACDSDGENCEATCIAGHGEFSVTVGFQHHVDREREDSRFSMILDRNAQTGCMVKWPLISVLSFHGVLYSL